MAEVVAAFVFSGGMADEHELDVYDAARFQYGAARFIYTLEAFRQSGRVPHKINRRGIKADYRISSAREGSFWHQVVAVAAPVIADVAIKVPIKVLIAYSIELLFPKKLNEASATKFLESQLQIEKERTKQIAQAEMTRRAEAMNTAELIRVLGETLRSGEPEVVDQARAHIQRLNANDERLAVIEPHKEALDAIPFRQNMALMGQTRKQLAEVAYPLKRSAQILSVTPSSEASRPIAKLDISDVVTLEGNQRDALPTDLEGSIKSYDKETGWGKWRGDGFPAPITFLVGAADRRKVTRNLLDKMKRGVVLARFYIVRGPGGAPKYLVLKEFVDQVGESVQGSDVAE